MLQTRCFAAAFAGASGVLLAQWSNPIASPAFHGWAGLICLVISVALAFIINEGER